MAKQMLDTFFCSTNLLGQKYFMPKGCSEVVGKQKCGPTKLPKKVKFVLAEQTKAMSW